MPTSWLGSVTVALPTHGPASFFVIVTTLEVSFPLVSVYPWKYYRYLTELKGSIWAEPLTHPPTLQSHQDLG